MIETWYGSSGKFTRRYCLKEGLREKAEAEKYAKAHPSGIKIVVNGKARIVKKIPKRFVRKMKSPYNYGDLYTKGGKKVGTYRYLLR